MASLSQEEKSSQEEMLSQESDNKSLNVVGHHEGKNHKASTSEDKKKTERLYFMMDNFLAQFIEKLNVEYKKYGPSHPYLPSNLFHTNGIKRFQRNRSVVSIKYTEKTYKNFIHIYSSKDNELFHLSLFYDSIEFRGLHLTSANNSSIKLYLSDADVLDYADKYKDDEDEAVKKLIKRYLETIKNYFEEEKYRRNDEPLIGDHKSFVNDVLGEEGSVPEVERNRIKNEIVVSVTKLIELIDKLKFTFSAYLPGAHSPGAHLPGAHSSGGSTKKVMYLVKIDKLKQKNKLLKKDKIKNKNKIEKNNKLIDELKAKSKKEKEKAKAKAKKEKAKAKAKAKKEKEKAKAKAKKEKAKAKAKKEKAKAKAKKEKVKAKAKTKKVTCKKSTCSKKNKK